MGHFGRFAETGTGGSWWEFGAIILAGIAILALLLLILRLRVPKRDDTAEIMENLDGQINSMLVQAGGALSQDEIGNNLGIPVAALADKLNAMEEQGRITREWVPSKYTYGVRLVEKKETARPGRPSPQPN